MTSRKDTSALIDGLLRAMAVGGYTATALFAPNALQALDKPLRNYLKRLDARSRERELRRTLAYMHRQGLVKGHYEHGLEITEKARQRLEKHDLDSLTIQKPKKWDRKWRLIFYDIPERHKVARNFLAFKLRQLGCQQLQKSVWIHPYACEQEINKIAVAGNVDEHITYLEVAYINNQEALIDRFKHLGLR